MPAISIIAQKVLAKKECGLGKLNQSFPKDSLWSCRALPLLPSDLHDDVYLGLFTAIV